MNNSKFLNGNKKAVIAFIITICLSVVLIFSGIIVNGTDSKSSNSGSSDISSVSLYDGKYSSLNAGSNKFTYTASYSGNAEIYIYNTSNLESIKVKNSSGTIIYSSYTKAYTHEFYVSSSGKLTIEITLKTGAASTGMDFNFS